MTAYVPSMDADEMIHRSAQERDPLDPEDQHPRAVYNRLVREMNDRKYGLLAKARADIDALIETEFREKLDAAQTEADYADHQTDLARIEAGTLLLQQSNYRDMVLVEWEMRQNLWFTENKYKKFPSGRKGKLEVRKLDTVIPANIKFDVPVLGEVFIRILKKDGTPGIQLAQMSRDLRTNQKDGRLQLPSLWLPEGEKPENAGENDVNYRKL
jgi:hypothetical protein